MRWPWQKKPQILVVEPQTKRANIALETGGAFRRGMWVTHGDRIGILTDLNPKTGAAQVMLTDSEAGLNVLQIDCTLPELQRARRSQIPVSRRQTLSDEFLERMGYPE